MIAVVLLAAIALLAAGSPGEQDEPGARTATATSRHASDRVPDRAGRDALIR